MHSIILAIFLLLCGAFTAACFAGPVNLSWVDDNNVPGTIPAYAVYTRKSPQAEWVRSDNVPGTGTTLNLTAGTYSARVVAVGPEGLESDPSNEITFTVPAAPGQLRIRVAIETTQDGENWTAVTTNFIPVPQ